MDRILVFGLAPSALVGIPGHPPFSQNPCQAHNPTNSSQIRQIHPPINYSSFDTIETDRKSRIAKVKLFIFNPLQTILSLQHFTAPKYRPKSPVLRTLNKNRGGVDTG
jgi:hypothetical protein